MVNIIDTRKMTRAERMAAAEEGAKRQRLERARLAREHAERNAAGIKAQQEWQALTPEQRAAERQRLHIEAQQRHEAANAAALAAEEGKRAPGPPENKMLLPAVQNKAPAKPKAPKAKPKAVIGPVPFAAPAEQPDATDAAVKLAKKHRISLGKVKGTGAGGRILLSDVEALLP